MMNIPVTTFVGDAQVAEYAVFQTGPTIELSDGYGTTIIGQWIGTFLEPAYIPVGNGSELFGGPDPASLGAGADVPLGPFARAVLAQVGRETNFLTRPSFYGEWFGASLLGAGALEVDGVWSAASEGWTALEAKVPGLTSNLIDFLGTVAADGGPPPPSWGGVAAGAAQVLQSAYCSVENCR